MKYGDKRDYKKIDIFEKVNGFWVYAGTTTWSKTCKEAVKNYCISRNITDTTTIKAGFKK